MKGILFSFVFILMSSVVFGGVIYKTSSNTLVWDEDFTSSAHLDSYNSYIGVWGGGRLSINSLTMWRWDGPIVEVIADKANSRLYLVEELNVYSSFYGGTPFVNNANFRYDVFAYSYNFDGTKNWTYSVMMRTNTNDAIVSYSGGDSRYPVATVDNYGNLYVVYSDLTNNIWSIIVQKVSNNGQVLWGSSTQDRVITNTVNYQPAVAYRSNDNSLFVAYFIGNNVRLRKLNANNGSDIWDVQVNTSSGVNRGIDMKIGPDGYLYVVWNNSTGGFMNVRAQRIDPVSGNRVSWGGTLNDKTLNQHTSYSSANYWYGTTEETVGIDFDDQTNMYVVFKYFRSGYGAKVFIQKIRCYNNGVNDFERVWSDDVKVANGGGVADAYPDIVLMGDSAYVVWINHGDVQNDHAMLQRVNIHTGQKVWASDIDLQPYGITHHARIASDGNFVYVFGQIGLVKVDIFGNVVESINQMDRFYTTFATFRTKNLFNPDGDTAVVPLNVRVRPSFLSNYNNSTSLFYVSPETTPSGASANYVVSTNTNSQLLQLSSQKGNVLVFISLDNRSNGGTNTIVLTNLKVEFVDYYFGDGLIGKVSDGSDRIGNLVLNTSGSGQSVVDYVYNDGLQSAKAFFYFVNNGTVVSNFRFRGTPGNPSWTVEYWLCTNNGTEWVTNQNITSIATGSGFVTNLSPYTGGNSNILVVRAFLRPSSGLSSGSTYTIYGRIDTQLPGGSYKESDVVALQGVVSSSIPDNRVSYDNSAYIGDDIRNSDGSGQTLNSVMDVGVEKRFYLIIRNRGGADNITLQGTSGDGWWSIRYFTNNLDVTSSVVGGTFSVNLASMADSPVIEIRISPTNSSTPTNTVKNIVLKSISQSDPTKEDVARVVVTAVVTKSELVVRKQGSLDWVGAGVFSTNYSIQKVSNRIDNGLTNVYEISITNLGSYPQNYTIKAFSSNFASGWDVKYFYGSSDITALITGQGFIVSNLNPTNIGSNIILRIISPSTYPTGANEVMGVYFVAYGEGDTNTDSKRDTVSVEDRLVSTRLDAIVVSSLYGSYGYNLITDNIFLQEFYTYTVSNSEYTIILSNPSPSSFEFNVRITNANNIQWRIVVSNPSSDITASVTNPSGWTTPIIPSGGTYQLKLYVFSTNEGTGFGASVGSTNRVSILLNSPLKASVVDRLLLYVERALPPDLVVKNTNEFSYRGFNLFTTNTNVSDQLVYNSYPNDDTTYKEGLFRVKNRRPVSENFIIKVGELVKNNDWDYSILLYTGSDIDNPDFTASSHWSNVTANITNTGGITNSVLGNSDVLFRIIAKPITATNNNDTISLKFSIFGDTTKLEDVGVFRVVFGVGIPDVYTLSGVGQGVISTNYSVAYTNYFDKALGDIIPIFISNQNPDVGGDFVVIGDNDKDQWDIAYYSSSTNDITSYVVGNGYSISFLPSGTNVIYVKIKAIHNSTYGLGQTTNFNIAVKNDQGGIDTIKVVSIITDRGVPDIYTSSGWSNVFESTPSSQILTTYIGKGDYITNIIYVGNWRTISETNLLYISKPAIEDFSIKVEKLVGSSWVDITSEVTNLSTKHEVVLGGTSVTTRIIMYADSNTTLPLNTLAEIDVRVDSQGKLKVDRAKIRYVLTDMGRPDIYSVVSGVSNGFDIYETTPLIQVQDIEIEKGVTNEFNILLGNRRYKTETMKVWSSGSSYSEFKLRYFLSTNGVDWINITTNITNSSGYTNLPILGNSNVILKIEAFLTTNSTNQIDDVLDTTVRLYSWVGVSNDNFKLNFIVKDKNRPDLLISSTGSNIFYPIPQRITNTIEKGNVITQSIIIMNAKNDRTSDFILEANSGYGDWSVKYVIDGVDVTHSATNTGTYISAVPPLGIKNLDVIVTLDSNSTYTLGSNYTVNLKLFSYSKLVRDEFNITFRIIDQGRPDVFIVSEHDNVYSPDNQSVTNKIEEGETLTNYFYVQNDRLDKAENITIRGSFNTNTNWVYEIKVNQGGVWNSIINDFTNNGYTVSISPSSVVTGQVVIYLSNNSGIPSGSVNTVSIEALSQGKLVNDSATINYLLVKPRPDIKVIPVSSGGNLAGNNIYETNTNDITNSTGLGYVMLIQPSIYSVIVDNDDVVEDTYVVKAFGELYVSNKWAVTVRDQHGDDITFRITNIGVTNVVSGTNSFVLVVDVKLINAENVAIGESNVVFFKVVSMKNTNKTDFVRVITVRMETDVFGKVVEKVSGSPISGAIVETYEARTGKLIKTINTANDGTFTVKLIPTTYKFVVKKDKYLVFEKVLTIPEVLQHTLEDLGLIRFNLKDDVLDIHSFPNPVNVGGNVRIVVNVPKRSVVKVYVVGMNGVLLRRIVNAKELEPGKYSFEWNLRTDDGTILKQGIYLLVIEDGSEVIIRRIMIK
ncbi:MAG: T9SS type A sorting domain-containing protein [Spirochaetes bacterium]|nr:T9SS type A sorting domain-containing protein [Spirochaetota bacterium]